MLERRLPHLIFTEAHEDCITKRILVKLAPILRSLGYATFFAESFPNTVDCRFKSISEAISSFEEFLNTGLQVLKLIGVDKNNKDDLKKIFDDKLLELKIFKPLSNKKIIEMLPDTFKKLLDANDMPYEKFIKSIEFCSTEIAFLRNIEINKIVYHGIDAIEGLSRPLRDNSMATAYLSAQSGIFSDIGLAHLDGIQKIIRSQLDDDTTNNSYLFFHIYSDQLSSPEEDNFESFNDIEIAARTGKIDMPIKLHVIDGVSQSDDEVIQFIIDNILEKKKILEKEYLMNNVSSFQEHDVFATKLSPSSIKFFSNHRDIIQGYLNYNRHDGPEEQREYDKHFGLVVTRK